MPRLATLRLAFAVALAGFGGAGCIRAPNPIFPAQSGSIGLPHEGTLRGGLPLGDTALPLVRLRDNDRRFAHPALAHILLAAAKTTGLQASPLVLGDVAAPAGGEISGHRSHRTGRDVDVLFYFRDLAGNVVRSPDFLVVAPDGLAWDKANQRWLRFDDARNWAFVRAVVTTHEAPIHWVFVHRALRERLLRYASAVGEEPSVIYEASERMAQPMPSGPHDDHFHVRIGCTSEYAAQGCENGWSGRVKPLALAGVHLAPGEIRAAVLELLAP